MRIVRGLGVWAAALVLLAAAAPGQRAPQEVDLELILAVDVSGSIDEEEARLQREGYIQAFRSPEVLAAIRSGRNRRIAVAYVEWAGEGHQFTVLDWTLIHDRTSALAFASALKVAQRQGGPYTSISGAIDYAVPLFRRNPYKGHRQALDISGDGPNNSGRLVTEARDEALATGLTINGLVIMNDRPSPFGTMPMRNLDLYYRKCVIGGPRAFLVVAKNFGTFGRAIRRKLVLEIAGHAPAPGAAPALGPLRVATGRAVPSCTVGEDRRRGWSDDNSF